MCFFRRLLAAMLLCLLIPCAALCESAEIGTLTPIEMTPDSEGQTLALYCGPTQGFYRQGEQTLDTGKPYVIFGQFDCWAMAAQGTAESFGPIGWVEAGSIAELPYEPQLSFEDGFVAVIEETAQLTDNPLAENPYDGWTASLVPGTQVTVLAQLDSWLYIQAEIEDTPVRAFIQANTVF